MSEICRFLSWDTDFFGFRIGQVLGETMDESMIEPINRWCVQNSIDCLYFQAASDDYTTTQTASSGGFNLMDIRIEFVLPLKSFKRCDYRNKIRPAIENDVEAMAAIARNIHKGGRFHFDPRLHNKADEFYGVWITNSFHGFADAIYICEVDNEVAGYVTCKRNANGSGQIGLIGVKSDCQGLGIGRELVDTALGWFYNQECTGAFVVTQGRNLPAQVLYQKSGFVTHSVHYWYHRWHTKQ